MRPTHKSSNGRQDFPFPEQPYFSSQNGTKMMCIISIFHYINLRNFMNLPWIISQLSWDFSRQRLTRPSDSGCLALRHFDTIFISNKTIRHEKFWGPWPSKLVHFGNKVTCPTYFGVICRHKEQFKTIILKIGSFVFEIRSTLRFCLT